MASTFSSDLKLELMATGENAGTWGTKTNTNLELVQQAIAGFESITLTSGGTTTLVMSNASISTARNMVIKFATASIAASTICTIPDSIEKFYIFDCTGLTNPTNLTIKTASGSGFSPDRAAIFAAYADGTNLKEISLDTLGGTIGTLQVADDAITAAKISNNAVITAGILQSNVTQNKLATNSVGTAQLKQSNVTLTKMAANSVGPSQLQSTAVTAGTYTVASITVDEDGRLTAASTGSAGGANMELALSSATGTATSYTAQPNANFAHVYMIGGGGAGRTGSGDPDGGPGAFGLLRVPIGSHPYTANFSVGTGGPTAGGGQPSNDTTFTTPAPATFTAGGGSLASQASPNQPYVQGAAGTLSPSPGFGRDYTPLLADTTSPNTQASGFIGLPINLTSQGLGGDGGNLGPNVRAGAGGIVVILENTGE